jgi:hypothetical protein
MLPCVGFASGQYEEIIVPGLGGHVVTGMIPFQAHPVAFTLLSPAARQLVAEGRPRPKSTTSQRRGTPGG